MIRSFLVLCGTALAAFAQTPCDMLSSLKLPDATITAAESVPAGPYRAAAPAAAPAPAPGGRAGTPAGGGAAPAPPVLPAFCRVALTLTPSADSHIEMEVWMPAENWNNKYQAIGNGGWAGSIQGFANMQTALRDGYATSGNDTGHKGADPIFALNHPEKLVDFAYRANHEMVLKSKALITAFYGKAPRLSYWNGCSTGGRQALMEAYKYPEDFDGVIAGAPANYQTHLHAWDLNVATVVRRDQHMVSAAKLATLNKAVLAACDASDGVKDGILNDPRKCKFDPGTLLCKAGNADDCLTPAELESVRVVYSPAKTNNGELIFPGKEPGSETGWTQLMFAPGPNPPNISTGSFQYATYNDANWDWRKFDLDRDVAAADEKFGYVNAPPDLAAFKNHGGKLLLYHGWNDPLISPENTISYYESVLKKVSGGKQDNWIRLFMEPGMAHCQGGVGPDQFNKVAILERWRESNAAPDMILASHVTGNNIDMTRPLCPYPQLAVYKGTGSTNDAANFSCKMP